MSNIKVLYEDNHLIAVFKPAGVLSQGDKTKDTSIFDEVKNYIKEKKNKKTPSNPSGKAGNVFLGLVHRLDRPVSGIMLFAKTSKGAARLSEQFRNHEVKKIYHVIVLGKPSKQKGVLVNDLIKDEKLKKARPASAKSYGVAKKAKLYYEIIKSNEKYSLLKIRIDTGKFHQIRVQLSIAGFPILGDIKYGAKEPLPDESVALCATELIFRAVTEEKIIIIFIDLPKEWQKYTDF